MNATMKKAIRTMLLHLGAPANFGVECVYAICDACNHIGEVGRSKTPQQLLAGVKPKVAHPLMVGSGLKLQIRHVKVLRRKPFVEFFCAVF